MRSRIVTAAAAAAAASLVAGLGACNAASKAASGAETGNRAASASATAAADAADTSSAPTVSAAPTAPAAPDGTAPAVALDANGTGRLEQRMRAKVAAVFSMAVTPVSSRHFQPAVNAAELAADFDSRATMDAVWGTGAAGSDHPMDCGMARYDGVALGAVQTSGGTVTLPVVLYNGTKAGTTAITMNLDPASGVIKGVACGGVQDLTSFAGITPVAAYYGALAAGGTAAVGGPASRYFAPAFTAWQPSDTGYDDKYCSANAPSMWIAALNGTTSTDSVWDFEPGPVRSIVDPAAPQAPVGFASSLAVDLGTTTISRVTCGEAFPPVPDSAHPAAYAQLLLGYYRAAADQASLGVDAKAAIRSYFTSDDAFTSAWTTTGPVPLLCAKEVPGTVMPATGSTPATSGAQTTVEMVAGPPWHPGAVGREASRFTVTFDSATMKIASIACTGS